jgi:hypothetical protein
MAKPPFSEITDRVDLVAGLDREADWVGADLFVVGKPKLDGLDALGVAALADELDLRVVGGGLFDALVDFPEQRLVSRKAFEGRRHRDPFLWD